MLECSRKERALTVQPGVEADQGSGLLADHCPTSVWVLDVNV